MYRPDSLKDEAKQKLDRSSRSAERDEIQRSLALALIIRQPEGPVKSPVITLLTEKTCIYNILEKHLKIEALFGADRWWRVCKSIYRPPLEAWRPRVNGIQLKALQGARLPETATEWESVRRILEVSAEWIKNESSPESFLKDLKELAAFAQDWWENRTKREGSAGPSKRASSLGPLPAAKRVKTGEIDAYGAGHYAEDLPHGVPVYRGPGGEPLQGFLDLMNTEQAGPLCNGPSTQTLIHVPPADTRPGYQGSRLTSRASAVTILAGEIHHTEIVPLNIGGRLLQTELSTLMAVPSSHLAQLARHWQNFPQQPIFLDRSPKVFEELLEQLRAVKFGEDACAYPTAPGALQALYREAKHFALDDIAFRMEGALEEAKRQGSSLQPQASNKPFEEDDWEYTVAFADTGFQTSIKDAVQMPMKALNSELQERISSGWEIFSASSSTIGRSGKGTSEERNLSVHFLLRRPKGFSN